MGIRYRPEIHTSAFKKKFVQGHSTSSHCNSPWNIPLSSLPKQNFWMVPKKKRRSRKCLQVYAKQLYFRYVSCILARNNSQLIYVQKVLQCPRNGGWIPDMFGMSRRRQAGKWQSNENTTRKDPHGLLHHLQHIPWAVKHGHQVGDTFWTVRTAAWCQPEVSIRRTKRYKSSIPESDTRVVCGKVQVVPDHAGVCEGCRATLYQIGSIQGIHVVKGVDRQISLQILVAPQCRSTPICILLHKVSFAPNVSHSPLREWQARYQFSCLESLPDVKANVPESPSSPSSGLIHQATRFILWRRATSNCPVCRHGSCQKIAPCCQWDFKLPTSSNISWLSMEVTKCDQSCVDIWYMIYTKNVCFHDQLSGHRRPQLPTSQQFFKKSPALCEVTVWKPNISSMSILAAAVVASPAFKPFIQRPRSDDPNLKMLKTTTR